MTIGMDFGTTNTGAATFDGQQIHLLPLDPASSTPHICRTSIYITRSKDYYLGSRAVNLYFNQNVGRPTRFTKVWVGEIMQVFAELPTFYRDVYVYEDEFSPGRLFLSIKTALRNPEYYGTVFLNQWYSASDLAAIFLLGMKRQMERSLGHPVTDMVLGRPVRFSDKPGEDKVAQGRLLEAAWKAGFEKVYLEYEPVAAALAYERTLTQPEVVLVFDFGGGTLDFTVMQVGPHAGARKRQVLATGGIPIAGDVFDQRLFRASIPPHLGEGDYFKSGGVKYPIPAHIFDQLTSPQDVLGLNTPENLEMLRSIHLGALHPEKTHALLRVVSSNYALLMFEHIERAKRELSEHTGARFNFQAEDFRIEEYISRARFEHAIREEYAAVRSGLEEVLSRAGLVPKDIGRVIRTGGSSQIPLFAGLLIDMFGDEKVLAIDTFSSVTSGLAILAHEIDAGLAESPLYTPASTAEESLTAGSDKHNPGVRPVDLDGVRQRLEVSQGFDEGQAHVPESLLFTLGHGRIEAHSLESISPALQGARLLLPAEALSHVQRIYSTSASTHVLAITDRFRFVSPTLETVYMALQLGADTLRDVLRLESGESVTALLPWNATAPAQPWIYMVTGYGQVRAFDARLLGEQVLRKPYFQVERRYVGLPTFLLLAAENDLLLLGSNAGRVAWASRKEIGVSVYEALRPKKDERLSAACACSPSDTYLALSPAGLLMPAGVESEWPQPAQPAAVPEPAPASTASTLPPSAPAPAPAPAPPSESPLTSQQKSLLADVLLRQQKRKSELQRQEQERNELRAFQSDKDKPSLNRTYENRWGEDHADEDPWREAAAEKEEPTPRPLRAKREPRLLRKNFSVLCFVAHAPLQQGAVLGLTSHGRLLHLSLPDPSRTSGAQPACRLAPGETLLGCLDL